MNTEISYLYRDASNYKVYNSCVIPGELSDSQKAAILNSLDEGEYFIPSLVGLPGNDFVALGHSYDPDLDHPFFELNPHGFSTTSAEPTVKITPAELVSAFQRCKNSWSGPVCADLDVLIRSAEERSVTGPVSAPEQTR